MTERGPELSSAWLLLPLVILLTVVGAWASPRNELGRPLLLLPDVKAVEDYRRSINGTAEDLRLLDGEVSAQLAVKNVDLFTQSRGAQSTFEHALRISQEVDAEEAPAALAGLHDASKKTAAAYLEAARLALKWVSLPEEANRAAAENGLMQARQLLKVLEENKWLGKTSR